MEIVNIKFGKEQLEEVVEEVVEKVIEKFKEDSFFDLSDTKHEEPNKKLTVMYLEAKVSGYSSEGQKVYFGNAFNTLSKECATDFDLSILTDLKKAKELKSQGWKEEVVYK
ncbi:hypothetical protein SM917_22535 [Escherichia coli]|nr:hypothetical protein [Escherichia coli]